MVEEVVEVVALGVRDAVGFGVGVVVVEVGVGVEVGDATIIPPVNV